MLALAIEAAKERATLGEISDAMESAFGRYRAKIQSFTGVYSKEIKTTRALKMPASWQTSLQSKKDVDPVLWSLKWDKMVTIVVPK